MSFLRRLFGRGEEHHHTGKPVPGWDAISNAADAVYPGIEPLHWGTVKRWRQGGPDPLDGISAYGSVRRPTHWHFVTYGLSELYRKESPDSDLSGWGIELTVRVRRPRAQPTPPNWPLEMLQSIARYVFTSGNAVGVGHHLDAVGPIAEEKTLLEAFVFAEDRELGTIHTPFGHVTFLQAIPITRDEYEAIQAWDSNAFIELLRASNKLLVTDLDRPSILADPDIRAEVERRTQVEGSSMAAVKVPSVSWQIRADESLEITILSLTEPRLKRGLLGRVLREEGFWIMAPERSVAFALGDDLQWHDAGEGTLHVDLPRAIANEMAGSLADTPGTYPFGEGGRLRIHVVDG